MNAKAVALSRKTFAALRFHNYRLYFISQILSFSGSWMQNVAQSWLVLELTGSGTALGTVIAVQFVPMMVLGPAGGLIADRVDKRRLILCTQSAAAVLALTLGVLTISGVVELWMVYVLAACFGTVTALDNPSRQTFVMEMVGPADIANAVTLNSVVVNAARIIGPAIGGIIIATMGIGECFVFNAVSYGAVITALLLIRVNELHPTERAARGPGQLRDGFAYAWNTPDLRTTLAMLAVMGIFTYEFTVTLPLLAEFTFGAGASGLAVLTSLMGAGSVVGGLAVAALGDPTARRFSMAAAALGVLLIAVAVAPTLLVAGMVMPLVGAASVAVIAMSNATLQLRSSPLFRGRVMSLFAVMLLGSTPIGGPIVGALAEHGSPRLAVSAGALAALAAAGYGWFHLEPLSADHRRTVRGESDVPQPGVPVAG